MSDYWHVSGMVEARVKILGGDTDKRWSDKSDETLSLCRSYIPFAADILDFGCGVGRMSSDILAYRSDVHVTGYDTSPSMLTMAEARISANSLTFARFKPVSQLSPFIDYNFVIASLVFQHMNKDDLEVFFDYGCHVKEDGLLYVDNLFKRRVWNGERWIDDGANVEDYLDSRFRIVKKFEAEPCHFRRLYKAKP